MKKLLSRNLRFAPTSSSLSLRGRPTNFKTKSRLIQLLRNCIDFSSLTTIQTQILKLGFINDTFAVNHLINSCVKITEIETARMLFDEMPEPNVVSWTSVISAYNHAGQSHIALEVFRKMKEDGSVLPNEFTFASVVKACSATADLITGRMIHACVEISGFRDNVVVDSSLVDMYGKCNDVETARRVFDSMGCNKNVVSWTSMITAYGQNAEGNKALELYREFNVSMLDPPNQFMLSSVIGACASLGRLQWGKISHGVAICGGHESNGVVASALVDMYAKCGSISYSEKTFRRIENPTVIPYTSMIIAAAKHGLGKLSLELFQEMVDRRINPNDVTFVGVLHACSHAGLIDKGNEYLNTMCVKYGVSPDAKHYTCVVDMLGRAGRLEEAYNLAKNIRVNHPDDGALLWGALLSASRLHGRLDIACEASKHLIGSSQQVTGTYVTLSNAYALAGGWENSDNLRSEMKRKGVYKEPGCSWIEIRDSSHVFYAGDLSCDRASDILSLLRDLERRMKERGYRESTTGSSVFVDVDEEAKDEIVGLHSERLALAFALLSLPEGLTIRIMKNLRMCRECHEAFKLISDLVERDIVVRDLNRFHHFKKGSCTCNDFW